MNVLKRILKRIKFRKTILEDQSVNVVDGIAKAQRLYKDLAKVAHPDKNPDKREIAEELMQRIVSNKWNYEKLMSLRQEVFERLGK